MLKLELTREEAILLQELLKEEKSKGNPEWKRRIVQSLSDKANMLCRKERMTEKEMYQRIHQEFNTYAAEGMDIAQCMAHVLEAEIRFHYEIV